MQFNDSLEPEVQTDKEATKDVPCLACGRRLTVNTFYAPAKARCRECRAAGVNGEVVAAPVRGKTDPATVAQLEAVLINRGFARALCPAHPDDEDHVMELKWVGHSPHAGPKEKVPGETVLHQCTVCNATVTYSDTVPAQLRCQNEVRSDKRMSQTWVAELGARDE